MNIERLNHLITVLEAVPAEQFNLKHWRSDGYISELCGTVACAVGWACLDPWFIAEGLAAKGTSYCPSYEGRDHWSAVSSFFDLSMNQTLDLFHIDYYTEWEAPTAANVINRIKTLIEANS